jgi:hypothetical protein
MTRPIRRRRFPRARATHFRRVDGAESLWRSAAFERTRLDHRGAGTRLYAFHEQYGEDVLEAAREGDRDVALQRLQQWITGHPRGAGDAWHPYVASTRAGNWVAAMTLEPSIATRAVIDSLARQLAHIARNVENEILGNHVIRNARALVLGGVALGGDRLVEQGLGLLRRELPEQVLADGGHYERSPVYHALVLRDLLEVEAATRAPLVQPVVERMRIFAAALARPDGTPALFNDGSVDMAPHLGLPAPADGVAVFAETGYVVARMDGLWLAFDCGAVGPAFLPAHSHADGLSFQLWLDDAPVIVDPGTWTYDAGADRDLLRSTGAHATLTVDRRNQFEPWGAFRSGPLPVIELLTASENGATGQVQWRRGVRHRRQIAWGPESISVSDVVVGHGPHLIESRLPVAPGAKHRVEGAYDIESVRRSERLFVPYEGDVLVRRARGVLPLELGWRIRR